MKKPAVRDEECITRLQATVDALAQTGASPYDIVSAFIDVVVELAANDRDNAPSRLEIVAELFSAGVAAAQLRKQHLGGPKPRDKK